MTAAVSNAAGLDPLREPCPRADAAAEIVEVPAGGNGQGDEKGEEEEEEQDHQGRVAAREKGPLPRPFSVEERAEAQARVGDRLEEVVAVVERPRRDAPRQGEGAETEGRGKPPPVLLPRRRHQRP